jgi:leucyl aminopeptidase
MASAASSAQYPLFEVRAAAVGTVDTDVLPVFQDSGKKPIPPRAGYAPLVERLRKSDAFAARLGNTQYIRFAGKGLAENVLFIGMGGAADLTEERVRQAGGHTWAKLLAEKSKIAVIHVSALHEARGLKPELATLRIVRAFAEGLALSAYQFIKYKSKSPARDEYAGPTKIVFATSDKALKAQIEPELERVRAIARAVRVTRDWSNEPSNHGTPEYFASESRRLAREYGLKCTVLGEKDAAREKMGLFLGVGFGAEREGKIVVLEYAPKGVKNPKTVALVGKGVTFDSGGISIKPSMRMEDMKHDMTGAATVMGAALLAAAWEVPNRVVTIMAFTENMPDGAAIQPGNVLTSRSGKTVEIINTDAEGRLVLADVLDYAHDFKPDAIINVATLTGAITVALGKLTCGLFGNDDSLIESIKRASDQNGERIWQMPLFDEYFEDMKSDTADMKNSANDGYGGAIRGAIFLKQFIKKGTQWAHLDIAGTATNQGHLPYYPRRGASGSFVRTLAKFAADY